MSDTPTNGLEPYILPLITEEVDPTDKLQLANQAVKCLHDARYNPFRKRVPDMSDDELLQYIEWHTVQIKYLTNHAIGRRIELDKNRFNKDGRIVIDPSTKPQLPPKDKKHASSEPTNTLGVTDVKKLRAIYLKRAGTDKDLQRLYKLLFDNNWHSDITDFGRMSKAQLKEAIQNKAMGA